MTNVEKKKFDKVAKSKEDLIEQLSNRGMFVQDKSYAIAVLSNINYYRLSGYWFKYQNKYLKQEQIFDDMSEIEKEELSNKFVANVTFQNIVDIYRFDTKLRSLCLDALEKIEIAVSTAICNHMCELYGGFWYLEEKYVCEIIKEKEDKKTKEKTSEIVFNHDLFMKEINELLKRNANTRCIKSFRNKYLDEYPPYWILSQLTTFGTLSKIYQSLPLKDKRDIAYSLKVSEVLLEKSLQTLSYVRNVCAHYTRLWDNVSSVTPPNIKLNPVIFKNTFNYDFHMDKRNDSSFYPIYYVIGFYLNLIAPDSRWCSLVAELISKYSEKTMVNKFKKESLISFDLMGFPLEWEDLPLFEKMLNNE